MHGVNKRERLIPMSVYRKELAKARLGDNIANHMGFIFTARPLSAGKLGRTMKTKRLQARA